MFLTLQFKLNSDLILAHYYPLPLILATAEKKNNSEVMHNRIIHTATRPGIILNNAQLPTIEGLPSQ